MDKGTFFYFVKRKTGDNLDMRSLLVWFLLSEKHLHNVVSMLIMGKEQKAHF